MGYETKALFVSSNRKFKGFCSIEATLEMGKIANGHIATLMNKAKNNNQTLIKKVREWEDNKLYELQVEIDKKLPYVYVDRDTHSYTDRYGEIIMLVTLEDFRQALIKEQAKEIYSGNYELGYRRFNMALKMIEMFDKKIWGECPVKVMLWGH